MPEPKPDCRVYERRPLTLITTCQQHFGSQPVSATVRNLSRGGAGLIVTKSFDVGATVVIDINGAIKLASITYVQPKGRQFAIGCRFISTLSQEEFASLISPSSGGRP